MADDKKSSKLNDFLVKYGEKVGLGIAILALLVYAVMAFGMHEEDRNAAAVDQKMKDIDKEMAAAHAGNKPPETKNWLGQAVGSWGNVIASPQGADEWGGTLLTTLVPKPIPVVVQKLFPVVTPKVTIDAPKVEIDNIMVAWDFKDFSPAEKSAFTRAKTDVVPLSHFVLERDVNGSGKWEVIGDKLDLKTKSYRDTKIEPKSKYAYKVTAYALDPKYLARGGPVTELEGATANPSGKVNTASTPQVTTLGIWKYSFINPTKPAGAEKGMVMIKIEKFEKGIGKVEKSRIHYAGDKIGWWEEASGADPVSRHRVSAGGKSIEVDFNTGATLKTVDPIKLPIEVKRCKTKFDSVGNKTGCDTVTEKRNYDTNLIVYNDDEGEHRIYSPNPGDLNQFCEDHGGRKIMTQLPPDKSTPANPDSTAPPKEDPKIALMKKKNEEAEKVYAEAEAMVAKDKKKAIQLYERLLKEFKDTDFVAKEKKALIEDRLGVLKTQQ